MTDKLAVGKIAFVEFAAPAPDRLAREFERIGMTAVARHRTRSATLYRQGDIAFVLNSDPASHAVRFAARHGPSIAGLAIPVDDPDAVRAVALSRGARPYVEPGEPLVRGPMVEGVGGSILYLVRRDGADRPLADFVPLDGIDQRPEGFGFTHIDHVTHCVPVPEMRYWVDFYRRIFGFSIVFEFEAKGKASGFHTQAVRDDGMNVCVTILEPTTVESQIQEFMDEYRGAGVQHVAMATENLYLTVDRMARAGTEFLSTPAAYYAMLDQRLPGHRENRAELERLNLLLDGATAVQSDDGSDHLLLQIFTKKMVGPIFFEAIQRKGNYGFGEGNAQALFDAIEREQISRGTVRG
jgi:4-hydroxyphenylpyruvate dioxygenase